MRDMVDDGCGWAGSRAHQGSICVARMTRDGASIPGMIMEKPGEPML